MKVTGIKQFRIADPSGLVGGYHIVKVETDAGISGLGEVGIRSWGKAVTGAIEHLSRLVIGTDPWSTEKLWQEMFRSNFFPADRVYTCAISAIDIALWDIKAKSVDKPVYKLLGGPLRNRVVCYPHIAGSSIEELVAAAREVYGQGWKFVRWHLPASDEGFPEPGVLEPCESINIAIESVAAVRNALPDIKICLDVHTRLDTTHSIQLCRELEPFKPFFIEDPIRAENPGSYEKISRKVNLPIAAGEQWSSKWGFREAIENEWIDYARIDLCIAGGLTESLKITHLAETHFIDIVPHNPLGPVSAAACVHLCMASTNVGAQEMPKAPGSFATDLFPVQIGFSDGYAFAHDAPGLGVVMNEALAEQHRLGEDDDFLPRMKRRDGAFTNW